MAQGYSQEYKASVVDGGKVEGSVCNAELRRYRCVLALDDTTNFKGASGDTDIIARLPPGAAIMDISVVSSVSLTTSQLAFGITGATTKFGAAKAYGTTANAKIVWNAATTMDDAAGTGPVDVLMTVSTADLPTTASARVVIDIIYSARG